MRQCKFLIAKLMLFAGTLLYVSCEEPGISGQLSNIESYIDSRPDSALVAIRQIDTTALRRRSTKAKYSLLHAIALDKNYIDTADTRVVRPAVDWYSRHGDPEEKLKAWMYLGTEQYNKGDYREAIVSFNKASGASEMADNQNLLGILYSRMADTFSKTMDYSVSEYYFDKALTCFHISGRKDQERLVWLQKAKNKLQLRKWEEADSCFSVLFSQFSEDRDFIKNVEVDYAMYLLSLPISNEALALSYFENNTDLIRNRKSLNLKGAYAYALSAAGHKAESDSLMNLVLSKADSHNLFYNYWSHRILKSERDYKGAYYKLWEAQQISDSLSLVSQSESAAKAQLEFNDQVLLNNKLKNRNALLLFGFFTLLFLFATLFLVIFLRIIHKKKKEEKEKMIFTIESLENQLLTLSEENKDFESKISIIKREKTKASFNYLSELLELLHNNPDELDYNSLRNTYYAIRSKVNILNTDEKARQRLENEINLEADNIIRHFREDFPELPEDSVRLACYIFAGFNNSTISILLDETSTNTRTLKNRLLKKITSSSAKYKEDYLAYFPRKS